MNDRFDLERTVSGHIASEGVTPPSDDFYAELLSRAGHTGQRPLWLALIKERPMRISSSLAVGSPMARVVALVVATLLLVVLTVGAGIAGTRLLAAEGAIVVAQDGTGTVATIAEAVAMAEDGDTVRVRPGTYVEAVVIENDISLSGDGPREEVIVEAPEGGPNAPTGNLHGSRPDASYALLLQDSGATVADLTFNGEPSRVHAKGGSPVLEGLVFIGVGEPYTGARYVDGGALVSGGSSATIRDSAFQGGNGIISYDASEPLITGNVLTEGANIGGHYGDATVIRGNEIIGGLSDGIGITQPTTALVEGNTIADTPVGIAVGTGGSSYEGVDPLVRGNSIKGASTGITVGSGAAPTIEENALATNDTGIQLSSTRNTSVASNDLADNAVGILVAGSDARVDGNTVRGGLTGVVVSSDATTDLTGNTIEGAAEAGIIIRRGASPTLTQNRVCDNGTNLVVEDGAEPIMEDNEICEDSPVD